MKCFSWDRDGNQEIEELWEAFLFSTEIETVPSTASKAWLVIGVCVYYLGTNPVLTDQHLKQIPLFRATHKLLLSLEQFLHLFVQLLHSPCVSQLYFSWTTSDMKLAMQNQSFLFYSPAVKIIYPLTLPWIWPTVQTKRLFLILKLKSFS